jgi:hypothetical protein
MAFVYAYSLDGDGAGVVKDYPLDTLANYQNGTGTNGVKKGDLVFLNAGLLRRVATGTASGSAIGVCEGGEFTGLVAQGQPYAAANSSFNANSINTTKNPNGVGKVRNDKISMVFKVPVKSGQTAANANIGVAYGIYTDAAGDQTVDLTNTTTTHVKVLDYTPDGKSVFVTLV